MRTWPVLRLCGGFCAVLRKVPVNGVNVERALPGEATPVLSVRHVCGVTFEEGGLAGLVALTSVLQKAVAVSTALMLTLPGAV